MKLDMPRPPLPPITQQRPGTRVIVMVMELRTPERSPRVADLILHVVADGAPDRELHRLATSLFNDIRRIGGVDVARAQAEAPTGSKSGAGAQLAELVVTGALSAATLTAVGRVVIAFVNRQKERSVKIVRNDETWEFTGVSADDQRLLAEMLRTAESRPELEG